jgi:PAS domain S-box-containing protein
MPTTKDHSSKRSRPLRPAATAAASPSTSQTETQPETATTPAGDSMLRHLPVAVFQANADGWIEFYNDAAAELWGWRPAIDASRWCGFSHSFLPDGRTLHRDDSATAICLRDGRSVQGLQSLVERPDGTRISISSNSTLLRDSSGRVTGAITAMIDITEQVKRAIDLQRLAAIVEGSEDAIISKTLDGRVTFWNGGAERIFGYTADEMIGQSIANIVPFDLQEDERKIIAKLASGERIDHYETVRLAKDGRRVCLSLTVSPLRDVSGAVIGASKVARDISARIQYEETLRQANEVAEQARSEAESANRAKTEFLAVMSHEIRTPLNGIGGFIALLTATNGLSPQQRRYAELVRNANAALLTIVDDILDFSKVEAGQLDLELRPFAPSALINDTIAIVEPIAAVKDIPIRVTIQPEVPEWLMGDHSRLRQILLNLLNNAVKFTESGCITVDVSMQVAADGRDQVHFSITDTGIGVPAEQQHRLFKHFSQADNSVSRRHGGTGLGLAICKRLVELMGGEIGIVSEPDRGSTVWFTALLLAATSPAPTSKTEPVLEDAANARILIVDDIDTNLEIVEAFLEGNGYHIDCVQSAFEAIHLAAEKPYDLILMDIQMPVMDGIMATRRLRAMDAPINQVPIIAMTGNVLQQQVRSFLEAGMNDHVGKPIERAKLCNVVRRWLPRTEQTTPQVRVGSPDFDSVKVDELVRVLGNVKTASIAERLALSLAAAFKSTLLDAQKECHALLATAGVFGLEGFVDVCRRVAEYRPAGDPESARLLMDDLRTAQSAAYLTLTTEILPSLREAPLQYIA